MTEKITLPNEVLTKDSLIYLWTKIKALADTKQTPQTTLAGYGISDAYTKTETDAAIVAAIAKITGVHFVFVDALPAVSDADPLAIYMVPHTHTNDSNIPENAENIYDEYVFDEKNQKYEKIASTDIDLSGYLKTSDLSAISNADIDEITAS